MLSTTLVDHVFARNRRASKSPRSLKRFFRSNVALGEFFVADVKLFLRQTGEQVAELEAGFDRFIAFGSVEWERFKKSVKAQSLSGFSPAFGDRSVPYATERPPRVFDDARMAAPVQKETNTGL